jgi:hypothetical protein
MGGGQKRGWGRKRERAGMGWEQVGVGDIKIS